MILKINSILTYYLTIIVTWVVAFFFLTAFQIDESSTLSITIQNNLRATFWSGLIAGIIWGTIFKIARSLGRIKKSYFIGMSLSILTNILSAYLLMFILFHLGSILQIDEIPETYQQLIDLYNSQLFYAILIYFFIVGSLLDMFYDINKRLGKGVLLNYLLGKYYKPEEEERIFLFMDLKSSTYYAEKLGHFKYSRLIQDCFKDISPAIAKNKAQIYQYVGDEVVLTWKLKNGLKDNRCLQVFFDFMEELHKREPYYQKEYGMIPVFKAGIHSGKVMVAEVGELKSEIAYHGDAINTASRIQGLCNSYQSKLLISGSLFKKLDSDKHFNLWYEPLGSVLLNGKQLTTELYKLN